MMILGVDPGYSTGVVLFDRADSSLEEVYTLTDTGSSFDIFTNTVKELEHLLTVWEASGKAVDVICVEDYDQRTFGDLFTAKLVGAVWSMGARWDIPVISPYPSRTKAVSDKLILEYVEHDLISHERDALRVIISALGKL